MNAIQPFEQSARALAPNPWVVETAQIESKSFGYNVLHAIGDGPNDVTATLFDFGCKNEVSGPEVVSIEDEQYSQTFDNFTYDIDIHPGQVYNSSLVSFDTSDSMTGFSIGHIKFCSLVLTKMHRNGSPDLDVSYLKTNFDVTFNLTNNAFGEDGNLALPSQNVTFPTNFAVTGVNPANPAEAANITNALQQAILSQLVNVSIPQGMTIVVDASNSTFGNGQMNATASVGLQYNCNSPTTCAAQNALAQSYLPNLMAALLNALTNGSVANALNNIANANNIPGINNPTIPSVTPPATVPVTVPTTNQGSTLQQSSTAPASLTVANVTTPASQAEEDAMVSTVQQAVTNILSSVTLPPGFNLNVAAGNATFANGNMGVDLGLTVSYPCSTQAECDSIENDDIPGIMAALIAALQNAINNGTLNNQIQSLAQQNGTTGLNNAGVPSPGGLTVPTGPGGGPATGPGSISGLASSSSLQGTLNLFNVSTPANQTEEDAMVNAVESALQTVLSGVIASLPPGFGLNVDLTDPSFANGGMSNTLDLTLTYPCSNQADCDNIDNNVAPAILAGIINALQNAITNGSLAAAIQNAAAQNGAPGLNNVSIPPTGGLNVPGVNLQGPATTVSPIGGSSSAPASVSVHNVTHPTSQAEEDAMVSTVQQAVTNILSSVTLPPGFNLNVDPGNVTFTNGTMDLDVDLTVSYPCTTQTECDSIENDDIPGIMAALIAALQNAINNGTLNNQIQSLAQQNGTTGLNNAGVPTTGGLTVPSTSTQVPTTNNPGSVSGLSASSSVPAVLNIQNAATPANQAEEDAMIDAVEQGIDSVLQTFAPSLPDGFDIFVDVSSASFINGTMSNNLNITISYPCANLAECSSIDANQIPVIIANLLPLLQQAIINGTLGNAISNAANQNGAPGLSNPSIPTPGGVVVPTTTVTGPVTVPGTFTGTSQSTTAPANLTLQNVTPPSNQTQQNAMVNAVQQGINSIIQALPSIPPGFNVSVDLTNVSFQNGTMDNDLNITVTYPCTSQADCDNTNNLLVPGIIANILAALQAAANNGTLAAAIQNAANQNGAPGLNNPTVPPGGINSPTTNVQVPATGPGSVSGLSSSSLVSGNFTVNNVIPPTSQAEQDVMVDIIEQAIESALQNFTASLPDGFDFFVNTTGVSFQSGDMLNDLDLTVSYPCSNQADCDSIDSGTVPGLVNNFLALLQASIDNGTLTALIQNLAASNNNSNLANASVGGLGVPTQTIQTPNTTAAIILSSDVDATFTVGNVTSPSSQAEEDAMVSTVEQAIANVLSNFIANLPPGFTLGIDITDATFSNGNMANDLTFQFTAPCSSPTECSALGPQFQALTNQVLALLQVAINNGSLAAAIQNVAAQNGTPGLNNSTTPPGSLVPTLTLPAPGAGQVNNTLVQNPTSGLIDSTVINANLTISVFAPTTTPLQQAIVTNVFQNSVAAVLSNFISTLPAGFSLNIDVTDSDFSGTNMANAIDFTFVYPCANTASCDSIENNVIPGLVTALLAALNNAIGSGALANTIDQGLGAAGLPPSQPTLTPNLPTVPQNPTPLITTNPPTTLGLSSISTNMTVSNVPPPANDTEADAMASVVAGAVDSVLTNFQNNILPPGFNLVINITDTSFANGNMLNNIDFGITYPCTNDCDSIHYNVIPDLIQAIIDALTSAINDGSLNAALTSIAATNGVPGFSNPNAGNLQTPTTTTQVPVSTTSAFTGVLPDEFELDVFTQFAVTACQCDAFTLQCLATPQALLQNQVFAICIIPNDDSVFVSNMELIITGSNGFEYKAVQFGQQTYVPNAPITQVTYTQTVLVRTYLVAGFFTIDGGSNSIVVSGTASLENAPGKMEMKTGSSQGFDFAIPLVTGMPKEETLGFLGQFIQMVQKFLELIEKFVKGIF